MGVPLLATVEKKNYMINTNTNKFKQINLNK